MNKVIRNKVHAHTQFILENITVCKYTVITFPDTFDLFFCRVCDLKFIFRKYYHVEAALLYQFSIDRVYGPSSEAKWGSFESPGTEAAWDKEMSWSNLGWLWEAVFST